ncbi:allantoate deiminase [Propionivibrio dicarboxylicus]|uniref:Allantoate deiminase n=1 Tax=Propionivibrio dicarboxylicus TaxID=83767 RepID=A0A1G8GSU3_9RHOO|nr:allantoate deiminase [Propionivibrio dicarboxylicus]SDH97465.1 allantoate deiminase [Propionivibrio dicarboxylicus]
MNIEVAEVRQTLEWLSSISDETGPGTTRLLYSPSWLTAQKALKEKFESLGMECRFDAVGNLFGTLVGSESPERKIATGSHVDTVVRGGKLDGQLGIFGGYLAVKHLLETCGRPKKSLEIISMAEEEGSRFPYVFWGSKNIFGLARPEDVTHLKDGQGVGFVDAMRGCGFDFGDGKVKDDLDAFIELHIEQGNFLEEENVTVGVVNSIVGQKRYNITLRGEANHAGTTLMRYRKDTVECLSRIVVHCLDKAKAAGDPLVLTFGKVVPKPNTVNVVPGETLFTMDCRHTDAAFLQAFTAELEADMKAIAAKAGIDIEIDNWMNEKPVSMDANVVSIIERVCRARQLNYKVMHSGAGHDSQIFAPRVPTGMIFVPSIKGISHNPAEDTKLEDLCEGIKALAYTLHELAY